MDAPGPDDLLVKEIQTLARQVLHGMEVAQRAVEQSESNALNSIEVLREAALCVDPSPELQATIDGLFKRISRPPANT